MKKIIKLNESDLLKIIDRVISEQGLGRPIPSNFGQDIISQVKSNNQNIILIQKKLKDLRYNLGKSGSNGDGVDGEYGSLTRLAVQNFQRKNGLIPIDGIVGPNTARVLGVDPLSKEQIKILKTGGVLKGTAQTKTSKTSDKRPKIDPNEKENTTKKTAKCETGTDEVLIPNAKLEFNGRQLKWIANGKEIKSWKAESGLTVLNTPPKDYDKLLNRFVKNKKSWSEDKNAGPLPEGKYSVGPLEKRSGIPEEIGFLEALWDKVTGELETNTEYNRDFCKQTKLSKISWGNYRLAIKPIGNQKMYNRSGFYLHGGSLPGSHGCIDLTSNMEDFAEFFGIWSAHNKRKTIPLIVDYNNPLLTQLITNLTQVF